MKLVWECRKSVPHLGVRAGGFFVYQPGEPDPYQAIHAVKADPGAIMAAEFDGDLVLVSPTSTAAPCRVIPFPVAPRSPNPRRSWRSRCGRGSLTG